jgi:hypothetical protein
MLLFKEEKTMTLDGMTFGLGKDNSIQFKKGSYRKAQVADYEKIKAAWLKKFSGSFNKAGKWEEAKKADHKEKKHEKRIETGRVDLEMWDYDEFKDFVSQNKHKIYCLECQVLDVPNNFRFRIFNPHITIQSRDIVFAQNGADLVIDKRSVKSVEAHFSPDGDRLESFDIYTGKYGLIHVQLQ